jgi:hypothetical protein
MDLRITSGLCVRQAITVRAAVLKRRRSACFAGILQELGINASLQYRSPANSEALRGCGLGRPGTVLPIPVPDVITKGRSDPASAAPSAPMAWSARSGRMRRAPESASSWTSFAGSAPNSKRYGVKMTLLVLTATGVKQLRHLVLGPIALEYSAFAVDGRPDISMVVYNPATSADADLVRSLVTPRPASRRG